MGGIRARTAAVLAVGSLLAVAVPAWATTVTLTTVSTADNFYDLYVDNSLAIHTEGTEWQTPETWSGELDVGVKHALAVKANNYVPWGGTNPAAFIAQADAGPELYFIETGGALLVTDVSWRVWYGGVDATPPADTQARPWTDPYYDDSAWDYAHEIGQNGVTPWGTIGGISEDAYWIWTSNWNSGDSTDTPVYFRQTLTPAVGGFPPIPEPLTMLGVGSAMMGLAGYVRRRQGFGGQVRRRVA